MKIGGSVIFNKVLKPALNNKKLYNLTNKMAQHENFYSKVMLSIIVIKHGIEAILHTRASYNNKKVPEEQRKFLAVQDAVNYTLAILLMATLGMFLGTKGKKYLTENNKTITDLLKKLTPEIANDVKMGIGVGLTLMGPILSHRIISPFMSMPISNFIKRKFFPSLELKPALKPYKNACNEWYKEIQAKKINLVA